ncbi:MAG: phage portal protein, partial [Eggerthellaceae bacterium]|nr:phage portal protein [Eggerthellaceae bacterium]
IFDVANNRLGSGLVIADMKRTTWSETKPVPVQLNMHVPKAVIVLTQTEYGQWVAKREEHPLDRPLMELFAFRPTGIKPFGQTRITKTVRNISDEVVRTLQNMAISSAFYAHPQKYLMGLTEEQYDNMVESKWKLTIDAMLLGTRDEDGNLPVFGQLPAVSPQPYIEIIRSYAALFSGSTGVPLNSLGIVQDNPSSAEAIAAAREDICIAAQDLIESNSVSLRNVALMAMAVAEDKTIEELSDHQKTVMAHFKDPSMPSIVSQADAMVKIAAADQEFAGTSVFYEQMGFDEPTRRRIMTDKQEQRAKQAVTALMASKKVNANGDDSTQAAG